MTMLWQIIRCEFISNVLTSRFIIGFAICLISTVSAIFVQVKDYEKRFASYYTALQEHHYEVRTWDLYSQINPKAYRKPNPLSIFDIGTEKSGANMVSIELAEPIWEKMAQQQGSENPFLSIFLSVDVIFVFKIVLSALAILFAFNTISGEREQGTIYLVLSNPVPRGIFLFGKYVGGMITLIPIVVISFTIGIVIAYASPSTNYDNIDLIRLIMLLVITLLYVSIWYLLGLLLSVLTKETATTLILSMCFWGLLTIILSNITTFAVEKFPPYKPLSEKETMRQVQQIWGDFKLERDKQLKEWGYKYPVSAIEQKGPLSIGINMSSPWELGFKEFYNIKPIENAELSKFQEVLGYQEPLRIRYANQAEELIKRGENINKRIRKLSRDISRLSFAEVYRYASGTIIGTDMHNYTDYMEQVRNYKRQIVNNLKEKNAFSSRAWFSNDQGGAEFEDHPSFVHQHITFSVSISDVIGDIAILVFWNIIFFMLSYVMFLKGEIK